MKVSATSNGRSRAAVAEAAAALLLLPALLACGCVSLERPRADGGPPGGDGAPADGGALADGDPDGAGDGGPITIDAGGCTAVIASHAEEGFTHVPCAPAPTYGTVPPSSGNHYAVWADFHGYDAPVPWGHLVHSLEHGAVVIVYNCPGGCPDEVAQAQAFIDALPVDPLCAAPDVRRVILAPDPTLDVRWAASAWTWTLRADCFAAEAFAVFVRDHYDHGRESLCNEAHPTFCPPG